MVAKTLLALAALVCLAYAAPQEDVVLGVLEPERPGDGDLGDYERIVSATFDALPAVSEVFRRMTKDRERINDPHRAQQLMWEMIPLSRKMMAAAEKAQGRRFEDEDYHRLNAAEKAMPSIITFMNELRAMDFFKPIPLPTTTTTSAPSSGF